ncbi:hypothetical protein M1B72_19465 [Geomonas paludis]|uniref:DUF5667 domain-containing protein n=1 Tax=Geomonas paludis TaxID=2740185 RepID=A0A6V8MRV8_9BACT|nr:hypothetical protein [Geomonas paludis]UPU35592.1 hypothetical protein M1B72_19465 [Geomonas paludis]GFO62830.1 hypothetical protein GMPD_07490 [Geomonas paludis]
MKTVLTVLALLAALPAFAAGPTAPGPIQMADAVPGSPGYVMKRPMGQQMMRSPQQQLMMAYHRNVANFGRLLYAAAEDGTTVSPQLARVAVAEMRRSVDEMEKYRASVAGEVPPERQRMMDQHLVQVKSHLRDLELLVREDRIDSDQVKRHVEPMLAGCGAPGCAPGQGAGMMGWRGGPGGHGMMMESMLQKVKGQDAELAALVRDMEQAPREKKLDLVAGIVARMVRQRAEMTDEMERNHHEMMHRFGPMQQQEMDEDDTGHRDHGWNDDDNDNDED